jgi:hypothetical protein
VSDIKVDIETACAAARRYAQLIHHHDLHPNKNVNYGHKPQYAWEAFRQQFTAIPRGAAILSIIGHSFKMEMRTLVAEAKARRENGQGKSPAPETSGRWNLV